MKERIYVCHTYYHVYVTLLKELALPKEKRGEATLVLSKMSNDFETIDERISATGVFEDIIAFDEKRDDFFPELAKYRKDKGNIVFNMISRMIFTRKYAKLEEQFVPVDFSDYKYIYIFSDSDPVGYYLNQKKIYYHAVEDGLDCIANFDQARFGNRGHFDLKAKLSKKYNFIFVENGYGKYCLDMEVNDISKIEYPCPYYIEKPRKELVDRLTDEDKEIILKAFLRNRDELEHVLTNTDEGKDRILILTEPLCTLDVREQIFRDIIDMYKDQGVIVIKPHPRDVLDYRELFKEYPIIDGTVPMEMLNFFPARFSKVVAVFTELSGIKFADEKIRLGEDFMDKYEDPMIHRYAERIAGKM
ncbi:MAG: lipooligosaccharide sialyltransferase [Lachnospiraceae bacterium]|nr:lipooligosaccharide sialyltransferase [Lachnospiraceae bacterium]